MIHKGRRCRWSSTVLVMRAATDELLASSEETAAHGSLKSDLGVLCRQVVGPARADLPQG